MVYKDRCFKDADLQVVDADQFVQTSGHHHLPQDGHDSDSMTVTLIDPHQLSCLQEAHLTCFYFQYNNKVYNITILSVCKEMNR